MAKHKQAREEKTAEPSKKRAPSGTVNLKNMLEIFLKHTLQIYRRIIYLKSYIT